MAELDLTAYAGDCVIRGALWCPDGVRLTDFLNDNETITVRDVRLFALDDGRVIEGGNQVLDVSELWAIEAPGALSNGRQRIRTHTSRVEVELGPYQVMGHLHGPPSADPLKAIHMRKPMIPITDATIAMSFAGEVRMRDVSTVIINRERAQVVKPVVYEGSKLDEFGIKPVDPLAKDMSSELGGP